MNKLIGDQFYLGCQTTGHGGGDTGRDIPWRGRRLSDSGILGGIERPFEYAFQLTLTL